MVEDPIRRDAGSAGVHRRRSPSPEALAGRAGELGAIAGFLDRVERDGAALFLSGQLGIGKTVLLDAAAGAAEAAGMLVLRAGGVEFEADVGFAALNQLLLPLQDRFDRLPEAEQVALRVALGLGGGPAPARADVSSAVLALLRRTATDRPVLLVVDDVHWTDRPSAAVLGSVARGVAGMRAGVLGAFRPEDGTVFDASGLPVRELGPLDDMVAATLIGTRFPMLPARVSQRLVAEAQGNPLVLLELGSALSVAERAARRRSPAALPLTGRLELLYASKVSALPAPTRRLLLTAALAGTGGLRPVAPGTTGDQRWRDLSPAVRAELVSADEDTGRITFRHPFIRSAVVHLATGAQRRAAHRELADLLAGEPERRAWHLAEAAGGPDEAVAVLLEEVAHRTLRRGDGVGAVTALLRAAELSPQASQKSRRLAEAAYLGADVSGDLRDVPRLLDDARRADPTRAGSLHAAVAASSLLLSGEGDIGTAHRLLVGTIDAYAGRDDATDHVLVEALHTLFEVCIYSVRADLWPPLDAAVGRLRPCPPPTLALLARVLGDPARASPADIALLDAEIAGLADETDPTRIERIATVALFLDRATLCRPALWRVVRSGRDGSAVASAINAMMVLCIDDVAAGRWAEAGQLAAEGLRLCDRHGYELFAAPFRLGQALLAAARGDDAAVRRLTAAISAWAAPRGVRALQFYGHHARALLASGTGDFETAYHQAAAISPPGVLAPHVPHALWVALDLVEAAVRTGRHGEAAAHVGAMLDGGLATLSPRLALLTRGAEAIAADGDRATDLFERALRLPGTERWPFDRARVQLAYGERLRRIRAMSQARRHLHAAVATFRELGAAPWVVRATGELEATGRSKPRSDITGPGSLTPQEREVTLLAAAGMTNKQIARRLDISPRTVGAHLRQIFPKLGIGSRSALRDALDGPGHATAGHPGTR